MPFTGSIFATPDLCVKPTEDPGLRIRRQIQDAAFLPPAFEIIPKLLLLLNELEGNGEALAETIRVDPGLTSDVLQVANSAAYAGAVRSDTVIQAVMRLGLREIYRIVMKVVTSPVLERVHHIGFARLNLWRHSLAVAISAEVLAQTCEEDPEIMFTLGLLHDVGKVMLAEAIGPNYIQLLDQPSREKTPLWSEEKTRFTLDHGEVGALLLKFWKFPEEVTAPIRAHHQPASAPKPFLRRAAILYAADLLAYRLNYGCGMVASESGPEKEKLKVLGLEPEELAGYENEILAMIRIEEARLE